MMKMKLHSAVYERRELFKTISVDDNGFCCR